MLFTHRHDLQKLEEMDYASGLLAGYGPRGTYEPAAVGAAIHTRIARLAGWVRNQATAPLRLPRRPWNGKGSWPSLFGPLKPVASENFCDTCRSDRHAVHPEHPYSRTSSRCITGRATQHRR